MPFATKFLWKETERRRYQFVSVNFLRSMPWLRHSRESGNLDWFIRGFGLASWMPAGAGPEPFDPLRINSAEGRA
jgi:hypothetical protein